MLKKSIVPDVVFSAPQRQVSTLPDKLFAVCLFLLSIVYVHNTSFFHYDPLSAILLFAVLLLALVYQLWNHHTLAKQEWYLWLYMSIAILCNLCSWNTIYIKALNFLFVCMLMAYWFLCCSHHRIKDHHSDWILMDMLYAVLHAPFYFLRKSMSSLSSFSSVQLHHKDVLKILTGCMLSIPILFLVLPLLSNADETFSYYLSTIDIDFGKLVKWCATLILAIPLFFYVFSMSYGNLSNADHKIYDEEIERKQLRKLSILPEMTCTTIEVILVIVYLLFIIASVQSIVGVIGTSKELFSYSSFAKQGFFELCVIAFGNLCLIFLIRLTSSAHKIRSISIEKILIIETLLLIISAMTKMGLYIFEYNALTYLRIYASWFMFVLFGIFLILLFQKSTTKHKILPIVYFFMACVLVLNLSNVSYWASDAREQTEEAWVQ